MGAIIGFAAASFLCGLAVNLPMLIAFRIMQGATGGVLQPVSQAVMLEAFPPAERGKAMAFWGVGIVVAPMLGPVLGGWLTDNYSWRWIFYINLPIGLASVIMTQDVHLRSAVPAAREGAAWTRGASGFSPSESARCRSSWTRDRRRTGSARASSRRWP